MTCNPTYTRNAVLAIIKPGYVYHAELEGRLYGHDRASKAEIAAMNARDFLDADDLETLAPPIVIKARAIADLAREEANPPMPTKATCANDPSRLAAGQLAPHEKRPSVPAPPAEDRPAVAWAIYRRTRSYSAVGAEMGLNRTMARTLVFKFLIRTSRAAGVHVPTMLELRRARSRLAKAA